MNEFDLFVATYHIEGEGERRAFLDRECAGDAALRRLLDGLLASGAAAVGPLDSPPDGPRPDPASPPRIGRDHSPRRPPPAPPSRESTG